MKEIKAGMVLKAHSQITDMTTTRFFCWKNVKNKIIQKNKMPTHNVILGTFDQEEEKCASYQIQTTKA